jgi:hypothetical protein
MVSAGIPATDTVPDVEVLFRTFQNIPQEFAIVPRQFLDVAEVVPRSGYPSVKCASNLRDRSWPSAQEISADPPMSSVTASVSENTLETIGQEK